MIPRKRISHPFIKVSNRQKVRLFFIIVAFLIYISLALTKQTTQPVIIKSSPSPIPDKTDVLSSQATPNPTSLKSPNPIVGTRTKFSNCLVYGSFPDTACTPGAVFTTITKEQICTSGYSSSVRNVPESEKNAVYAEYDISSHASGQYEIDHNISLEMGGSNDIANLWPEAANPKPGFHEKDKVEDYLHGQLCSGAITLQQAQYKIISDWVTIYNQIFSSSNP